MKRSLQITFGIVILVGAGLLGTPPASAICANARLLDQCPSYHYITSPGPGTPASLNGVFWGLGGGNPSIGSGDDNGAYAPVEWLHFYQAGFCIGGAWSNAGVDGCVDAGTTPNPKRTVVALSEEDASGLDAYFALLCKEANPSTLNYDFGAFGDRALAAIPYPRIASGGRCQSSPPPCFTLTVRGVASFLQGPNVALDPSCGNLSNVIRGYKLYYQVLDGPNRPTSRRTDAGWQLIHGETPIEQDTPALTVTCPGFNSYGFLAVGLVFEGGFELPFVSRDVLVCSPILADRPTAPKGVQVLRDPRRTQDR